MQCKSITKKHAQCTRNAIDGKEHCKQHLQVCTAEPIEPLECIICLELLEKPLECGHPVHIECVCKSMKAECPVCRTAITVDEETSKRMDSELTALKNEVDEELSIAEVQRLSNEPEEIEIDATQLIQMLSSLMQPTQNQNPHELMQMLAGLIGNIDISE